MKKLLLGTVVSIVTFLVTREVILAVVYLRIIKRPKQVMHLKDVLSYLENGDEAVPGEMINTVQEVIEEKGGRL